MNYFKQHQRPPESRKAAPPKPGHCGGSTETGALRRLHQTRGSAQSPSNPVWLSSTRYKYGPSKCNGDRLPKDRLEDAVLTQLAGIYRDQRLIDQALADAAERGDRDRPQLEEALAGCRADIARTDRKLDRYYAAFESGELSATDCHERVHRHRVRLERLREQEADLSRRVATRADAPADVAALTELAGPISRTSSPVRAPNKRRNSSVSSSRRSACTTAAGSCRSTAFRRRCAQYLLRWAVQGSNLRPWD